MTYPERERTDGLYHGVQNQLAGYALRGEPVGPVLATARDFPEEYTLAMDWLRSTAEDVIRENDPRMESTQAVAREALDRLAALPQPTQA